MNEEKKNRIQLFSFTVREKKEQQAGRVQGILIDADSFLL